MTDMLTAKDMQDLLQVDRSTIYRMADAGRLPAIKVGRQWRFPAEQVDGWLQTNGLGSTPAPKPSLPAAPAAGQPAATDFAGLLPMQCVQLIQDTFAEALGVMVVITNLDGEPVTEVSNPCGLFDAINHEPDAVQKCLDSWKALANTIDLEPRFTPSHLGLLCARAMIRVGAELKGMVFVGGIAPPTWPPAPEQLASIAAEFGTEASLLEAHLTEVYYLDKDEQTRILTFVQRIANIVAHIINERNELMGKLDAIAQLTRP